MPLLTAREVADLLGVVPETVYSHERDRRLLRAATNPLRFEAEHVRSAKLLNEVDIVEGTRHAIPRDRLLAAKMEGAVTASEDGRYSLADVEDVRSWVNQPTGAPPAATSRRPAITGGAVHSVGSAASSRPDMFERYLVEGRSPNDLPDEFWLTPRPPPFIPPLDTYREVVQGVRREWDTESRRSLDEWTVRVWRSGHYQLRGGKAVWAAAAPVFLTRTDLDVSHLPAVGQPPAETRVGTWRWREARTEWILAWESRRELRKAQRGDAGGHLIVAGGGAVDLEAILVEYHMFFDRPADLPPEFWEGRDLPPFEPPTDIGRYTLGKTFFNDGFHQQKPMTAIMQSAGWFAIHSDIEGPVRLPAEMHGGVDGHLPEGSDHPALQPLNAPYERALREWEAAWKTYQDFCKKFG